MVAMLLICAGTFLTGCSKDKEAGTTPTGSEAPGKLVVSVLGVADVEDITPAEQKANAAGKLTIKQDEVLSSKVISFKGFDAVVDLQRNTLGGAKLAIKGLGKGSGNVAGQMAAAVANGVKYRLLLYKRDGSFYSSTVLTSGQAATVTVETPVTYDWYAYSYNSTEEPENVNPSNPALVLPAGKDVLYAKGSITLSDEKAGSNNTLGIIFKHRLARVGIEVNTMGMFADMSSLGVSVTGLSVRTGTLNLRTGALSNLNTVTQTINQNNFVDAEPPYKDRKIAYFYTADSVTRLNALQVSVNALALTLDNGSTRTFSQLVTAPSRFTFDVTPRIGASYNALINLIESPVTFGSVSWARANLYYHSAPRNRYRFSHTNAPTRDRNTYFSYGSVNPENYGYNSDPCLLVYPQGVWRMPTQNEFVTLTGILGIRPPSEYGVVNGAGYIEYRNTTGTSAPYPSNYLRFNMNGQGNTVSVLNDVVTIDATSTYGTSANYWSSTNLLDLGIINAGAYFFRGTRESLLGSPYNLTNTDQELLNIGLLGSVNVAKTNFKNIRCVRATSTAPTPDLAP